MSRTITPRRAVAITRRHFQLDGDKVVALALQAFVSTRGRVLSEFHREELLLWLTTLAPSTKAAERELQSLHRYVTSTGIRAIAMSKTKH